MARGELHIELAVNYADGSLADVSRGARLLYVDALCLCKRTLNDGVLTRAQLDKLAYPETRRAVTKYLSELTAAPADGKEPPVVANPGGTYTISAWLLRNRSRAEVHAGRQGAGGERSQSGSRGNHLRWHQGLGVVKPDCRWCPDGIANSDSLSDRSAIATDRTETETETTSDTYQHRVENRHASDHEPGGPPGPAESLLGEHVAVVGRVNPQAMTEFGQHIATLLHAGYQPDEIRAGFVLWRARCTRPSALPDMVDLARRNGGRATSADVVQLASQQSTTDRKVGAGTALAAQYAAQGR